MTTPAWQAPINGELNNLNATDKSAHLNQFLSAHSAGQISYGNPVVRPTNGDQSFFTEAPIRHSDFAQQFTMSGTTIGRIAVPIKTFGNGADTFFTLCPDNGSNLPNTTAPIAQIKVPASVLNATGAQLGLENANTVWQLPYNNTYFATNFSPTVPWLSPAASIHGSPTFFATCTSGNYSLLLGGFDTTSSTGSALCFSVLYTGAGTVAAPIPQPALPQATFQAAAITTADTVVFAGGTTTSSSVNNVWSASWDASTGVIGAWSSQAALPVATTNAAMASWGETVYYVGGNTANTIASGVASVYLATVTNNQVSSWKSAPSLPRAVSLPFVAAINGWLIVAGGVDTSNTARAETYYAKIQSDGSIGNWQQGPNLFQAIGSAVATWCTGITTNALITYAGTVTGGGLGSYISVLTVGPNGPAPSWNVFKNDAAGTVAMSAFTDGNGVWYLMGYNTNNTVSQNFFQSVPMTSIPLYATGLTNGSNYWLVTTPIISQSDSDYTGIGLVLGSYPLDIQFSPRHQNAWTTFVNGYSMPLIVFDTTAGSTVIHTVEDLVAGVQSATYQKWSTYAYGAENLLTGLIETTMQPNNALNSNPTFTSGTSPWTAVNGTITQSNVQTHGGFPFSGLLTPTGGFTQAYIQSENFPVAQTTFGNNNWYLVTGWFFSPTGTTNFSLSVNWYDSSGAYISTSSSTVTLTANTWTQVSNYFQPPATAAFASINPTEGGSPGVTNLIYASNTYIVLAPEMVGNLTSIAQVNYQTGTLWPPVGVTQSN